MEHESPQILVLAPALGPATKRHCTLGQVGSRATHRPLIGISSAKPQTLTTPGREMAEMAEPCGAHLRVGRGQVLEQLGLLCVTDEQQIAQGWVEPLCQAQASGR